MHALLGGWNAWVTDGGATEPTENVVQTAPPQPAPTPAPAAVKNSNANTRTGRTRPRRNRHYGKRPAPTD
ncbi:MAG TPA: hypothetical protein VF525_15080 [Pyrinomonadaceae bacterium]